MRPSDFRSQPLLTNDSRPSARGKRIGTSNGTSAALHPKQCAISLFPVDIHEPRVAREVSSPESSLKIDPPSRRFFLRVDHRLSIPKGHCILDFDEGRTMEKPGESRRKDAETKLLHGWHVEYIRADALPSSTSFVPPSAVTTHEGGNAVLRRTRPARARGWPLAIAGKHGLQDNRISSIHGMDAVCASLGERGDRSSQTSWKLI
ncbi:hypothetical protein KM043_002581 [Ampulex compressa]|nr:hypothetical protein KM043_002581 [Ampulex compressa]